MHLIISVLPKRHHQRHSLNCHEYEASQALRDVGVFMAGAWTVETAYAKALVGLSAGWRGEKLQAYLQQNVLGEWD